MPPSYRISFVCLGNICRSPMAAVVMRQLADEAGLGAALHIDSAGTGNWHVGGGANPGAMQALSRRGADGSAHVARQFGPADFAALDLILALDRHNAADLRALAPDDIQAAKISLLRDFDAATDPDRLGQLDVPDPYGRDDADFDHALDLITAACVGLLASLPLRSATG